ncbi:MAG: TSUP family transporter, partial [Anaerolineae bacterium]|nr:TSUP family transporter [Anaerolineae bacterium]
ATIIAKTLNFATNIAALLVFLTTGRIAWIAGAFMIAGQAIGAWLGSKFLFKINPSYLRILIVLMCFAMLIKYSISMGWFSLDYFF